MSSAKVQKQSPVKPVAKSKAKGKAKANEKIKEKSAPSAAPPIARAPVEVDKHSRLMRYATTTTVIRMERTTDDVLTVPLLTGELLASILDKTDAETDRDFTAMKKFEAGLRESRGNAAALTAGRSEFHAVVDYLGQNLTKVWREETAAVAKEHRNLKRAPPADGGFVLPPPPPPRKSMLRGGGHGGNSSHDDSGSDSDFEFDDSDLPPLEHVDRGSDASEVLSVEHIDGDDESEEVLDEIYDVD